MNITFCGWAGLKELVFGPPAIWCETCAGRGVIRYCKCPHCNGAGYRHPKPLRGGR